MSADATLRISAGRGPREARRFVGLLADVLARRFAAIDHGCSSEPGRVVLRVPAEHSASLESVAGTHLLVADLRGPKARRRWFAQVELDLSTTLPHVELSRRDLPVRFVRSRGPGGQNVNKRATAVQIVHRPTGLLASCDRHRSQTRNRALLTRTPVMQWRLDSAGLLVPA